MDISGTIAVEVPNSTVLQLELPDYLPYLELFLNWTALVAHGITAISMGFLILVVHCQTHLLRVHQFAPSLAMFFYAQFAFAVLSTPYQLYRVCQWRTPSGNADTYTHKNNPFSAYTLFWLSLPELVYYGTIPCAVFLLTIERFISLKWPLTFTKHHFLLFSAITFGTILLVNAGGHLLELPLDMSVAVICETASCTTTKYRLYFHLVSKIVFSCATVACSMLLLLMLHGIDKAIKLKNRVIVFTVIVELIFGVLPCFISILYNQVLDLPIGAPNSGLKGEIGITCCAVDGAMCGIVYLFVLVKRKTSSTAVGNTAAAGAVVVAQKMPQNLQKNLTALANIA